MNDERSSIPPELQAVLAEDSRRMGDYFQQNVALRQRRLLYGELKRQVSSASRRERPAFATRVLEIFWPYRRDVAWIGGLVAVAALVMVVLNQVEVQPRPMLFALAAPAQGMSRGGAGPAFAALQEKPVSVSLDAKKGRVKITFGNGPVLDGEAQRASRPTAGAGLRHPVEFAIAAVGRLPSGEPVTASGSLVMGFSDENAATKLIDAQAKVVVLKVTIRTATGRETLDIRRELPNQ